MSLECQKTSPLHSLKPTFEVTASPKLDKKFGLMTSEGIAAIPVFDTKSSLQPFHASKASAVMEPGLIPGVDCPFSPLSLPVSNSFTPRTAQAAPSPFQRRALQPNSLARPSPLRITPAANKHTPTHITPASSYIKVLKPVADKLNSTSHTPVQSLSAADGKENSPGTPSTLAAPPPSNARWAAAYSHSPSSTGLHSGSSRFASSPFSLSPSKSTGSPAPLANRRFPGIIKLKLRLPSSPRASNSTVAASTAACRSSVSPTTRMVAKWSA